MTTKITKNRTIKTPNYLTLELLSNPNFKSVALLTTVAFLTLGSPYAHAADARGSASVGIGGVSVDANANSSSDLYTEPPAGVEGYVNGQTTVQTRNGIVPTDPATRTYVKDNARLEATVPHYIGGGASVNIQTDGSGTNTRVTDAYGNEVPKINDQVNVQGQATSTTTTTTTTYPDGRSVTHKSGSR